MVVGKEQYVYRLMKAKCSCGSKNFSQYLNLDEDHGVVFNDNEYPLMNANDHVSGKHVNCFGRCKSLWNPYTRSVGAIIPGLGLLLGCKCTPLTPTPWIECDENYYIDGAPALTVNSVLHCAYGGEITITLEAEQQTNENEDEQQKEEKDKKELLPSEVQEKIDSFVDEENFTGQKKGTTELELSNQGTTSSEDLKETSETPKMFERYDADITEVQKNENYAE